MQRFMQKHWTKYGIVVAAILAGTVLAFPIQSMAGGRIPFVIFFPIVCLVAAFGGVGPGVLATALSSLAVATFWMEPHGSPYASRAGDRVALILYLFACAVVCSVGGSLRRARIARRESVGLLKALLDHVPAAIYMKDRRGTLRVVNQQFAEIVGKRYRRALRRCARHRKRERNVPAKPGAPAGGQPTDLSPDEVRDALDLETQ